MRSGCFLCFDSEFGNQRNLKGGRVQYLLPLKSTCIFVLLDSVVFKTSQVSSGSLLKGKAVRGRRNKKQCNGLAVMGLNKSYAQLSWTGTYLRTTSAFTTKGRLKCYRRARIAKVARETVTTTSATLDERRTIIYSKSKHEQQSREIEQLRKELDAAKHKLIQCNSNQDEPTVKTSKLDT